jgi:broad specificity phosphatase PhoE
MDSPTRLYLIRHGEVEERYHRVFGGRIDMELSFLGRKQARALSDYLERMPLDAIYASPMKRVQQTLEQLLARQSKRATVLEDLREVDFGAWAGLSWDEINTRFGVTAFDWLEQLEKGTIEGAESVTGFRQRIEASLRKILNDSPGKTSRWCATEVLSAWPWQCFWIYRSARWPGSILNMPV